MLKLEVTIVAESAEAAKEALLEVVRRIEEEEFGKTDVDESHSDGGPTTAYRAAFTKAVKEKPFEIVEAPYSSLMKPEEPDTEEFGVPIPGDPDYDDYHHHDMYDPRH